MGHQNHLYVWEDRFLYLTPAIASGLTQRHTTTLLVALGEDGFELGEIGRAWRAPWMRPGRRYCR